jgi:hypothetical protein
VGIMGNFIRLNKFGIAVVLALLAVCVYYFFLITRMEWAVQFLDMNGQIFAKQWESWTQGKWDVDPAGIRWELFVINEKFYFYFGIVPSLVRGLMTFFYSIDLPISRLTMYFASVLYVVSTILLVLELKIHELQNKKYFWIFLAVTLLGSPVIYLLSTSEVYHEAILWSVAFVGWFNWLFVRHIQNRRNRPVLTLSLLGVFAGLALNTRAPMGVACHFALAGLGLYFLWDQFKRAPAARIYNFTLGQRAIILMGWIFGGLIFLSVNYERTGNPFEPAPLQRYIMFLNQDGSLNERGQGFKTYGTWRLDNLLPEFEFYFLPHANNFRSRWPFLMFSDQLDFKSYSEHMDNLEPTIPLTLMGPFYWILLGFGVFFGLGRRKNQNGKHRGFLIFLTFSNFIPCLFLLGYWGACFRYTADFTPFLIVGSALCLAFLMKEKSEWFQKKIFFYSFAGIGLLTIFSMHLTYILHLVLNLYLPVQMREEYYKLFILSLGGSLG